LDYPAHRPIIVPTMLSQLLENLVHSVKFLMKGGNYSALEDSDCSVLY
jgi:hypothetical protein